MTPYEQGLALYASRPDMALAADLRFHMERAFMACTPDVFVMLRPVCREWPIEWLSDLSQVEPLESADTWFVWLLAGDLATACQWLPKMLPWFGFSRRGGGVRFVSSTRLMQKALAKRE